MRAESIVIVASLILWMIGLIIWRVFYAESSGATIVQVGELKRLDLFLRLCGVANFKKYAM